VIFDYIRNNYKDELPACIVIFTDGNGPYPSQAEAMGIPVLWIINNQIAAPTFGKVARLLD
jgi:predicted metal-dependent peptidase